jgi:hypothetical protein
MTYRYMKNEKALPLWAALGAPLVGVPLMVGLLAIATPKAEAPAEEPTPTPVLVTEPVDSYGVAPASRDSAPELKEEIGAG